MLQIKRIFFWLGYNLFARHLPRSNVVYSFGSRYIRQFVCKRLLKSCGDNVNIESKAIFYRMSWTSIGNNSGIGFRSFIGAVLIGDNVMMGPEVMIISGNKTIDRTDIPIMEQQRQDDIQPITIEDDVWIGARVIILPGIKIGKGAILGAGSVITNDVEPYSVMGGNPARVIRKRSKHD